MYTLYSFGTPNGMKPTIMLEEIKQAYEIKLINIQQGEQFSADFLRISPNNKIPVLYDAEADFYLFESVAILQYLAEKHQQFLPQDLKHKCIEVVLFSGGTYWSNVWSIWAFSSLRARASPLCAKPLCRRSAALDGSNG